MTDGEPTRDEIVDALRRVALDGFVRQFVTLCQLAAELHPEEMQAAMMYVFDARAAADRLDAIAVVAARVEAKLAEIKETQQLIDRESQQRFDYAGWVSARLAKLEDRVERAARFVGKIYSALTRAGIIREKANGQARGSAVQRDPARQPGPG